MNSRISKRYQEELAREGNIEDIAAAGSLWKAMRSEVRVRADFEPIMSTFFHASVLSHDTIEGALSFILASKLDSPVVSNMAIREIIEEAYWGNLLYFSGLIYMLLAPSLLLLKPQEKQDYRENAH